MAGHANAARNKREWAEVNRKEGSKINALALSRAHSKAQIRKAEADIGLVWDDVDKTLMCGLTLDEAADALLTDRKTLDAFLKEAFGRDPEEIHRKYKARTKAGIIDMVKFSKTPSGPIFLAKSMLGMGAAQSNDDMTEYYKTYIDPKGKKG